MLSRAGEYWGKGYKCSTGLGTVSNSFPTASRVLPGREELDEDSQKGFSEADCDEAWRRSHPRQAPGKIA